MHIRRLTTPALIVVVAALSGCSGGGTSGTATTPAPPSSTGGLPFAGAPNVGSPLTKTTAVESDPCSAITAAQIESLGGKVQSTQTENDPTGNNCVWTYSGEYGTITAGFTSANKEGLSSLYASSKDGSLTTFKPQPAVDGYPAVVYAQGGEGAGVCTLAVGVRNDLLYTINSRLDTANPRESDSCGLATDVAKFAVEHLKGA
ncbi:DUF3558 domain-containing protein [Amycolatopsis sp. NPDC051903]|uniref:DUF3558 domain-containing protein n=1 Tax=Amycolatopsis sp. NPDC051903 TaxID=3363936 RepID=UPI0037AEFEE4